MNPLTPVEIRAPARLGGAVQIASWSVLSTAGVASLLAPGAVNSMRWAPLLGGLVVTGLPHGAVDHLVPGQLGRPLSTQSNAGFLSGYVTLAAGGVALWLAAPRVGVAGLLTLAALHWGQGEIWFLIRVEGRAPPRDLASYGAIVAARGLLPVLGPLVVHPREFETAVERVLSPFRLSEPVRLPCRARSIGAFGLGGAMLAGVIAAVRDGPGARRQDIAEIAGLAAFFAATPPVFAIGVYFVAWHAPRHLARLAQLQMPSSQPWRSLLAAAAPCSAIALTAIAVTAATLRIEPRASSRLAGPALAVVFGLTVPHSLVVLWMDQQQGMLPARSHRTRRGPHHTKRLRALSACALTSMTRRLTHN